METSVRLKITSSEFEEGSAIPEKYTCKGQDISPELCWDEPPAGTRSFALIMDDPDAPGGVFTHWVIYNLAPQTRDIPEGASTHSRVGPGAQQGRNDFGRTGYGGPCPPPGSPHRYQFNLYALDRMLDLGAGSTKRQVLEAIKGHILAQGRLTGIFPR